MTDAHVEMLLTLLARQISLLETLTRRGDISWNESQTLESNEKGFRKAIEKNALFPEAAAVLRELNR